MNQIIFGLAVFFLLIGLVFFYRPSWLLRFNEIAKEYIFNDNLVLLERRQRGFFLLLVSFLFFYWGYHRAQYTPLPVVGRLISIDRLMYQSLHHLYAKEYQDSRTVAERVLMRDPKNAEALYILSATQFLMNDLEGGRQSWQKARELSPNSTDADHFRSLILKEKSELRSELQ